MKFKITTDEVKKAMKKTGLAIDSGMFYGKKYNWYGKKYEAKACAIGQLYTAKTNSFDNDDAALNWARRKYGKAYINGFINGFDGSVSYENDQYYKSLNKKYISDFKLGFKNGKALRKTLLNKGDITSSNK